MSAGLMRRVSLTYRQEGPDGADLQREALEWFREVADRLGLPSEQVDLTMANAGHRLVELTATVDLYP